MRVQIVSFHCVLKDKLGRLISSSFNSDVATSQPENAQALPGFVMGLQGLKVGEKKRISVSAKDAYGFYDPQLSFEVSRDSIHQGKKVKEGDQVEARLTDDGKYRIFRVVATNSQTLTLDGNHPLAGQDLVFDVEVTSSREELDQEIDLSIQNKNGLLC